MKKNVYCPVCKMLRISERNSPFENALRDWNELSYKTTILQINLWFGSMLLIISWLTYYIITIRGLT